MKRYLALLALSSVIVCGQSFPPAFPDHVATSADLLASSDQAVSKLGAGLTSSALTIILATASTFVPNEVVNVDTEQIKLCGVAGTTLTVCAGGRGVGGTTPAAHQLGATIGAYVNAVYHNTMVGEVNSVETWLTARGGAPLLGFSAITSGTPDAGITRTGAAALSAGNGTSGDATAKFTAGSFVGDGSCITAQGVVYAACFGVAAANADNAAAIRAAINAAYNLASPGQATPSVVQLPPGTLAVKSQIVIPHTVMLKGTGRGDSAGLVPTKGNHTVIQAVSGFTVPSAAWNDQAVILIGGSGPTSLEYFGEGISDLTIDANTLGAGVFVGNSQEQSESHNILIINFTTYGLAIWGANNNSNTLTANSQWNLPAQYQGSANDGAYSDWELDPGTAATHSTIPLMLMNTAGSRGIKGLTIDTIDANINGGVNTPDVCGQIWGTNGHLSDIHCEGPNDGFVVGPVGGPTGTYGDGAVGWTFVNVHYFSPASPSGCTLHFSNSKGVTAIGTRGGQTATICDDGSGYQGSDTFWVSDFNVSDGTKQFMSTHQGINFEAPIVTTGTITGNTVIGTNQVLAQGPNPCLAVQISESSPWVSPFHKLCENANGDVILSSTPAPTVGANFPVANIFVNGQQTLAFGQGLNHSGLNLSNPADTTNNVLSIIGNNMWYDMHSDDTFVPTVSLSNNGQPKSNGLLFDYDGMSFLGQTGNGPGDYTIASALNWGSARFNNAGTQVFGNNSVSGVVSTFTDSAGSCTINPAGSAFNCTSDKRLKKNINYKSKAMSSALSKIMLLKPVEWNWKSEKTGDAKHTGFIAQDVQRVVPEAVATDAGGNLSLNQQGLIPYLVKAIQQQQAEIGVLKAQVKELQSKH